MAQDLHFAKIVRKHISRNNLSAAISILLSSVANSNSRNEVINLSGRLEEIQKKSRLGIINEQLVRFERNQIRNSLLELVDRIMQDDFGSDGHVETQENNLGTSRNGNYLVGNNFYGEAQIGGNKTVSNNTFINEVKNDKKLYLWLAIFIVVAFGGAYFFWKVKWLETPTSVVIYLEDENPSSFLPGFSGTLKVILDTETLTQKAKLGKNIFSDIPSPYLGEKIRVTSSSHGFIDIDTLVSLERKAIRIRLQRNDEYAFFSGFILDHSSLNPVGNASVILSCCQSLTDTNGYFEINIPPQFQDTTQRVEIFKQGYKRRVISEPVMKGEAMETYLVKD